MLNPNNNPLHAMAKWASEVDANWSPTALGRAQDAFIDTIAVMIPAHKEPVVEKIAALASRWGAGACIVAGRPERLSTPMAALVGGTAAHALDFDDNFDPAKAHASAVLVPALLAAGQKAKASGAALLDAYIVGLQIMGLVGQGVNPFHRSRGWHATATVGAVGTAAGVARLMGLDAEKTAHAISLGTSMAGGFMSQFGTMTKPLHAGLAAAGAVQAAEAAAAGITAGANTLHGPHGMGTLMVGPDVEELRAAMAGKAEHGQTVTFRTEHIGEPLHIEEYGLKVKRFPNCGSVHRSLDGVMELRDKYSLTPDMVEKITVRAPAAHLRNLMYEDPQDAMQAKFSLEYGIAVALSGRPAGLADYTDEAAKAQDLRPLMALVEKDYVEKLESEFPTEVHIITKDGRHLSTHIAMPVGSTSAPLTRAQLWDKFSACIAGHLDRDKAQAVQQMLDQLPDATDISKLMAMLAG